MGGYAQIFNVNHERMGKSATCTLVTLHTALLVCYVLV